MTCGGGRDACFRAYRESRREGNERDKKETRDEIRSATASIGAIQEAAQSTVPVIGYTVPYAVSRIVLALAGIGMLLAMK